MALIGGRMSRGRGWRKGKGGRGPKSLCKVETLHNPLSTFN